MAAVAEEKKEFAKYIIIGLVVSDILDYLTFRLFVGLILKATLVINTFSNNKVKVIF